MTYEEWFDKYKPITNIQRKDAPFEGFMFETFGDELAAVKDAPMDRVWTLLDFDDSSLITNGCLFVNRMGYFITELPYDQCEGEFIEIDTA